jgi:hypothetical protein
MPAKVERPRLIVGIDFGTTFSGYVNISLLANQVNLRSVAWGMEDCQDDIEVIQTWPGGGNSKRRLPIQILQG